MLTKLENKRKKKSLKKTQAPPGGGTKNYKKYKITLRAKTKWLSSCCRCHSFLLIWMWMSLLMLLLRAATGFL